jgi:DegV family protein with EDD domain
VTGVVVVSDSTGYLPRRLAELNGIRVLPQYVHFADGRIVPEPEIDLEAFFDEMRSAEQLPTTSQPTTEDFVAAYQPELDGGNQIVSVHIASSFSRTCQVAREAAAQLDAADRVHVVDSQSAGAGLALLALATARRASGGETAAQVAEFAEDARREMKLWFAIDTLEFLKRGGRIGPAGAWIGATLRVKPILSIEEGRMKPVERVRTSKRAFERLVDYAGQRHASGADAWIVQHVRSGEEAERLVDACRGVFGTEPVAVSEIGAVVGAHTGPGLLGLAAMPPRLLT